MKSIRDKTKDNTKDKNQTFLKVSVFFNSIHEFQKVN